MNEILQIYTQAPNSNQFIMLVGGLYILWLGALIGSQLWNWTLAWIDDADKVKDNPVNTFVAKIFKIDTYWHGEMLILAPIISLPFVAASVYFYNISIWFVLAYGIAYSMRAGRRVQKKLQKHIEDKEAHK